MPVFVKDGRAVLYMHVPKTGGTAIEAFFKKNGFRSTLVDKGGPDSINRYRRCAPQHMNAGQIMALLRPGNFDYVFMTVREPLSRLISEYKMRARVTPNPPPLVDWFQQMFSRYVEDSYIAENHLRPQVEFLLPNSEVFRQEDGYGEEFVSRIEEKLRLKLEHPRVDRLNIDDSADIDPTQIARISAGIRQFYRQDYLAFGY